MINDLKVTLIETDLAWEHPGDNRKQFENYLLQDPEETDLYVLPEMFTSGFTMNPQKVAETMDGPTTEWLHELSQRTKAAICGSMVIEEKGAYFNRFLFVSPDTPVYQYDKKHTFTLAGEHKAYKAGHKKVVFEFKGWKNCPMICYDLRFPVWSRNTEDYDLLIYVANWPKPRVNAWDALLKARAIENMCYCVGVNRIGFDGNGHEYPGHSAIYDVLGNELDLAGSGTLKSASLNYSSIGKYRSKLNFLGDRDSFRLED
jgi:omega-amidase